MLDLCCLVLAGPRERSSWPFNLALSRENPKHNFILWGDHLKMGSCFRSVIERVMCSQGIKPTRASYRLVKVKIRHILNSVLFICNCETDTSRGKVSRLYLT